MKKILAIGILIALTCILFLNFNTKKYACENKFLIKQIVSIENRDSIKLKNYKQAYNNSVELYNKITQYHKVVVYVHNYIVKKGTCWEETNNVAQFAINKNKDIYNIWDDFNFNISFKLKEIDNLYKSPDLITYTSNFKKYIKEYYFTIYKGVPININCSNYLKEDIPNKSQKVIELLDNTLDEMKKQLYKLK